MLLALDTIASFARCRYKAFLKCTGEAGVATDYELLQRELADAYQEKAIAWLATRFTPDEIVFSPPSLEHVFRSRSRLILNAPCKPERGSITFPAIERTVSRTGTGKHGHVLIVFSPNDKLSKDEKLTAAMLGSALSSWHGLTVTSVEMIHGPQFSSTTLVLLSNNGMTHLAKEATDTLHDLEAMVASQAPPLMYLNDDCGVCEYRDRCRKNAVDRDDLSLLRGLQPKEIEAWKERGIFTVTQLAHTFRPKTMGRSSQQPKRHSQPLQAMAIRDNKTYIRKRPEMPTQPTKVCFDVEGIPEQQFFYLIGAVVARDEAVVSRNVSSGLRQLRYEISVAR
jgi:predicted RecB family nuclease